MIYVNYLSGSGRINGISAGDVSGTYPTLFTPAGFTFSIWGLIYLFGILFLYRLYKYYRSENDSWIFRRLSVMYIMSCLFNIGWIFSWHYNLLGLSVVLMLGLLISLGYLYHEVTSGTYSTLWQYLTTQTPFSLYLGWICIAMVANISVWLISIGWDGSPLTEGFWASIMVIFAAFLNLIVLIRKRDIFFALVYLWAAYGILMARSSDTGQESIWVARAVISGMILVFGGILYARYVRVSRISK